MSFVLFKNIIIGIDLVVFLQVMTIIVSEICPTWTTFFGFMGAACSLIFANFGSCYGTAKAGVGVMVMGVMHPQLIVKSTLPTILAGMT